MDGTDRGEWMTVPQVAAALGVSQNTVRLWIRHGHLPSERPNEHHQTGVRRYRLRRSDVRAFAELHYRGKPRPPWPNGA